MIACFCLVNSTREPVSATFEENGLEQENEDEEPEEYEPRVEQPLSKSLPSQSLNPEYSYSQSDEEPEALPLDYDKHSESSDEETPAPLLEKPCEKPTEPFPAEEAPAQIIPDWKSALHSTQMDVTRVQTKLDSFEGHFGKLTEVCFVNNILPKYFSKFLRSLYYVPRYPKTSRQTTNHFFTEFLPWRPLLLNISKTTLLLVYSRVYFSSFNK